MSGANARLAVIDIGSNSIHLLVAEPEGRTLRAVRDESRFVNLGADVRASGRIGRERQRRATQTVVAFADEARRLRSSRIRVLATHAVRSAENSDAFVAGLRKATSVEVEVISPSHEAALAFQGARLASLSRRQVVIDIGGGSTQIAVGDLDRVIGSMSLKIGSGLLAGRLVSDRITRATWSGLRSELEGILPRELDELRWLIEGGDVPLLFAGGALRRLSRFVDAANLPAGLPVNWIERSEKMLLSSARDLARSRGVSRKRIPIARGGLLLAEALLERLQPGNSGAWISAGGVREGAILHMAQQRQPHAPAAGRAVPSRPVLAPGAHASSPSASSPTCSRNLPPLHCASRAKLTAHGLERRRTGTGCLRC